MATQGFARGRSLEARRVRQIRRALTRWGDAHFQSYPWRGDLTLWQALATEIFLQRTRARQVVAVFLEMRRRYPTAVRFAAASPKEIADLIAPLGLRWRAPLLHDLARSVGESDGRLPRDQAELERLPGVGPYAAAAALSLHAGVRAVIIDANVVRVLCRLVGAPYDGETRRKEWLRELAERLTPPSEFRRYNYALLDLSMQICRHREPLCDQCPLQQLCVTGSRLVR